MSLQQCYALSSLFVILQTTAPPPSPTPQGTPPFGFPPTYSKTIEKKQQNPPKQRCLPQNMQKPYRKKQTNKQTQRFQKL